WALASKTALTVGSRQRGKTVTVVLPVNAAKATTANANNRKTSTASTIPFFPFPLFRVLSGADLFGGSGFSVFTDSKERETGVLAGRLLSAGFMSCKFHFFSIIGSF